MEKDKLKPIEKLNRNKLKRKLLTVAAAIAVIVAVVLVATFAGQRNSLSDKNQELTRQLSEADLAVKTTQELADTRVAAVENDLNAAKEQMEEAEAALNEAQTALTAMTAERDDLQAKNTSAVTQLNDGIRQAQQALYALTGEEAGPEKDLREARAQLEETQVLLSSAQEEIASYQQALDEAQKRNESRQSGPAGRTGRVVLPEGEHPGPNRRGRDRGPFRDRAG